METETVKTVKLAISQNVHPNTDGSPWGWIVIDGTRLRVATWSGYEEKERCEKIVRACNSHYELLKEVSEYKKAYEKACKRVDDLNEQKADLLEAAKMALDNLTEGESNTKYRLITRP